MNLPTDLVYLGWDMCYIQNGDWGPEGGQEIILTVAPDMARSTIVAEMRIT